MILCSSSTGNTWWAELSRKVVLCSSENSSTDFGYKSNGHRFGLSCSWEIHMACPFSPEILYGPHSALCLKKEIKHRKVNIIMFSEASSFKNSIIQMTSSRIPQKINQTNKDETLCFHL